MTTNSYTRCIFTAVDGEVVSTQFNYFPPKTKVTLRDADNDSPLVFGREYTIESCSETEPVCRVFEYHWSLDTNTLKAV